MQELKPTWPRTISVWWLIIWRSILGAAILGSVAGLILGIVAAIVGASPTTIAAAGGFIGLPIGIVWMIVVVRMALRKNYRDFRLALIPRNPAG